ncbi:hypothetical protein C8R43DRAFT_1230681 [Mycena crocata]|nr:hypothetical protein C8R43DRAFT_1230681 [Mycena crocata]
MARRFQSEKHLPLFQESSMNGSDNARSPPGCPRQQPDPLLLSEERGMTPEVSSSSTSAAYSWHILSPRKEPLSSFRDTLKLGGMESPRLHTTDRTPEIIDAPYITIRPTSILDPSIVQNFPHAVPEMEFLLNTRVSRRLQPALSLAQDGVMCLRDPDPFRIFPVLTADFFKKQSGCAVLRAGGTSNPTLTIPSSFALDLHLPFYDGTLAAVEHGEAIAVLFGHSIRRHISTTRAYGPARSCIPTTSHGKRKSPRFTGAACPIGGHIYGENYRHFTRFRLVELSRNHPDLVDAKMTAFAETHPAEDCDREAIIEEFDIEGPAAPREEV